MRARHRVRSALGLVVMTAALGAPPAIAATPFVHEAVESSGLAYYTSLALDAAGNPRVSYQDNTFADLKYASRNVAGVWTVETVDAVGTTGYHTSLALDAAGNPRISYQDLGNGDLRYASRAGSVWTLETVEAAGNVGSYSSLALDAAGNPHIAYHEADLGDLKYARKSGGVWIIETVDAAGFVGADLSLALDAAGNPHISYNDLANGDLRYARKNGGAWSIDIVDVAGFVGVSTSIALDGAGNPRISYWDATNGDLKYASRNGGWTIETVDAAGNVGLYTSLALDAAGDPHIAYRDATQEDLKYARRSGGAWTVETVDAHGNVGMFISLALDAQGNPFISHCDNTNFVLKLADAAVHLRSPLGGERWAAGSEQTVRWSGAGTVSIQLSEDGGFGWTTLRSSVSANAVTITVPGATTEQARIRIARDAPPSTSDSPGSFQIAPDLVNPWWTTTVEDNPGAEGDYTSLALDAQGNPCIAFRGSSTLRYASRAGGTWTIETVDPQLFGGSDASLVLDPQGDPHISYAYGSTGDLRYASRNNGTWTIETVDAMANTGYMTSLALDAQGNPRISYWDETNKDLKFASKNGGVWTIETVDAAGDVGLSTSLALDAQGNPHISYYFWSAGDLRYAKKSGGVWTIETVDAIGDAGASTSLALDSQGNPRIAYLSYANFDLKYAIRNAGVWAVETIDGPGFVGYWPSLRLDAQDRPHISYHAGPTAYDLKYAHRPAGLWIVETIDTEGVVGQYSSLALDAQGHPRISYYDVTNSNLKYASAAIELGEPSPGDIWPVGSSRTVTWDGTGRVDLYLSGDGGSSWQLLQSRLTGGEHRIIVPHTPSKFARFKLERAVPYSVSATSGFFTIETSIALLAFAAQASPDGGADLTWSSDPGPADLGGYRIERAGSSGWNTLVALTRETTYHDAEGTAGSRYRLSAINGLGQALVLGEASLAPQAPLAAWPLPYTGGALTVRFAATGGLGGGAGETSVELYDLAGRRIRTIARGAYTAGYSTATWDGRDEHGQAVGSGIYFLRCRSLGHDERMRVVVIR